MLYRGIPASSPGVGSYRIAISPDTVTVQRIPSSEQARQVCMTLGATQKTPTANFKSFAPSPATGSPIPEGEGLHLTNPLRLIPFLEFHRIAMNLNTFRWKRIVSNYEHIERHCKLAHLRDKANEFGKNKHVELIAFSNYCRFTNT